MAGVKEPSFPPHPCLCGLLTGSAAILVMARQLGAFPEKDSPLQGGWGPGGLPSSSDGAPATTPPLFWGIFVTYGDIVSTAVLCMGNPCSWPKRVPLGETEHGDTVPGSRPKMGTLR